MAIQVTHQSRYMARGPVVVRFSGEEGATLAYTVYEGQAKVYEGCLQLPPGGEVEVDFAFLVGSLREEAGVLEYALEVQEAGSMSVPEDSFLVYGGGVSRVWRRATGGAVLADRLKRVRGNFFLTTRTAGSVLRIPENEVLPLRFYGGDMEFEVMAGGRTVSTYDGYTSAECGDALFYLDPRVIRSYAAKATGAWLSVLEIWPFNADAPACTIVLTEARPTDYYVDFVNSLGAVERVALCGVVEYAPELEEDDDIMRYDTALGEFARMPRRKRYVPRYTASTGLRPAGERLFITDMLCSPRCWLVAHGTAYAAKVAADGPLPESTRGEPADLQLTIELLDTEDGYTPLDALPAALTDNEGDDLCDNIWEKLVTISD